MKGRFEVLTALKMTMLLFSVVTLCGLMGRYHCFSPEDGNRMNLEHWCLPACPHSVTAQKDIIAE
jgi:hypothetical protein